VECYERCGSLSAGKFGASGIDLTSMAAGATRTGGPTALRRPTGFDRDDVYHFRNVLGQVNRPIQIERPFRVCAVTRRRFPVGASPTRQTLQPEAIGAVMEVTKWLKPSISVSRIGDSASVQAVTRVNAEQASKRTMRRPTRRPFRGRLIRLGKMSEVRPAAAPG
jgi:hypothetical protein